MRKTSSSGSTTNMLSSHRPFTFFGSIKDEHVVQDYVNLLEIPLANLQISEQVLGRGEFGLVRKGLAGGLRGTPGSTAVAVKSVKNPLDEEQRRGLLEEMKTMTKAGRHLNIINLLAATLKETLLLLEYCTHGSLLRYRKSRRDTYRRYHVNLDEDVLPVDDDQLECRQNLAGGDQRGPSGTRDKFNVTCISTTDLINYVYQIARGMEYLSKRMIIHRHLAARNVLVAD